MCCVRFHAYTLAPAGRVMVVRLSCCATYPHKEAPKKVAVDEALKTAHATDTRDRRPNCQRQEWSFDSGLHET
jgi:hypothetical protein